MARLQWTVAIVVCGVLWWMMAELRVQTHRISYLKPQQLNEASIVLESRAEFCSAVHEAAELVQSNSIVKILFAGSPSYWGVPPVPNLMHFAAEGLKAGDGGLVTEYTSFQDHANDMPADGIMLDIGANYGFTALPVAAAGRTVYAFEPVPYAQRFLRLSVCLNAFWDKIKLIKAAVGAQDSTIDIYVPKGKADNSALSKDASTANVGGTADTVRVRLLKLDTFAQGLTAEEIKRIVFVKIDVQGQEGNVIKGGMNLLSQLMPGTWVVAEHDDRLITPSINAGYRAGYYDDIEGMIAAGYAVYDKKHGSVVPESRWRHEAPPDNDWWYKKR